MKKRDGFDASLFHRSVNCNIFDYFGAHKKNNKILFRVWAPHADEVYLVGDFNSWSQSHPMKRITDKGVWECTADYYAVKDRPLYKYKIKVKDQILYKADPFGRIMQTPPDTATVWYDADAPFGWTDSNWIQSKRKKVSSCPCSQPINIYEVHIGSFMRHKDGSYMTYRELAPILASYLKKMSYTHVELLPVAEHPQSSSLGYDISGFYSVTSRFGSPDDLKYLIDTLHNCGIGVILDFVPSHFPCDEHGLFEFDGQPLYESYVASSDGSKRYFDISKTEVKSFLISCACFYAREFHADGLRVAEIRRMLYLDFEKKPGEWTPNRHRGNINFEAVEFLRQLNRTIKQQYPDVLMIADECSSYQYITDSEGGGLGFDMAWDPSPFRATLSIASGRSDQLGYADIRKAIDSIKQKRIFPLSQSCLNLSSTSLLDKTKGCYENRFAQLRALFTYMMTLPGKKLSFMSNEYGQFAPWQHSSGLEWFMLGYDSHRNLRDYVADLGTLYLNTPALWELDCSSEGFHRITAEDHSQPYIAYNRTDASGRTVTVLLSLSDSMNSIESIPLSDGTYRILLSSAYKKYGGSRSSEIDTVNVILGSLHLDISPFESLVLEKAHD